MKHRTRTFLSLLLVLSLCLGMMPMSIFATDDTELTGSEEPTAVETVPGTEDVTEDEPAAPADTETEPAAPAEGTTVLVDEQDKTVEQPIEQPEEEAAAPAPTEENTGAEEKAEEPAEVLVKGTPAEEARGMVKFALDAATEALTTEADTKSKDARTIYVVFYLDYVGPYKNSYQSNNFPEGTKTLADIAPDVSDKKDGYVFMYWCHGNYNNKKQIPMDEPLVINSDLDDTIHAGAVWGHIVEYVIDGEKIDYDYDDGYSHIMRDGIQIVKDGSYTSQLDNIKKDGYVSEWPEGVPVTTDRTIANGNPVEGRWVKAWTVSFVDTDGTELSDPQTVKEGEKAKKPDNDPHKEGYIFDGWFLNGDNEESVEYFVDDEAIQPVTEDVTLVAHWTPKTQYTVTFYDENGNKIADADQTVYEGDFAEPYDYESEDYAGQKLVWNVKDEDGNLTEYGFDAPVTGNLALYASWKDVFTVLYHVADPTSSLPRAMTFERSYPRTDAASISLLTLADIRTEVPNFEEPEGYRFKGWATSPQGTPLEAKEDGTYDLAKLLEENDSAETNNAAQSAAQSTLKPRISISDRESEEARPGTIIPGGGIMPFRPSYNGLELYAVWEEIGTITYHTNYPTGREDGKPEDISVTIDLLEGLPEDADIPETFVIKDPSLEKDGLNFAVPDGYEFEGWYIKYETAASNGSTGMGELPWPAVEYPGAQMEVLPTGDASNPTGTQNQLSDAPGEESQSEQGNVQVAGDTTGVTSGHSDRLYQPTESYNVYYKVDLYAIWLKKPVVRYHTNYENNGFKGLEEAHYTDLTEYSAKDILEYSAENADKKPIKVLTFNAIGSDNGFKEPDGYIFDHWTIKFNDADPRAISPVMPEFEVDQQENKERKEKSTETKTEKSRALDMSDSKFPVKVDTSDWIYPETDQGQALHLAVDFNAYYVPAFMLEYNSNYPSATGLAVQTAKDRIKKSEKDVVYTVLPLEGVTKINSKFVAPVGYKFLGWSLDDPNETEKLLQEKDTVTVPGEELVSNGKVKRLADSDTTANKVFADSKSDSIPPEQEKDPGVQDETSEVKPIHVFYAQWKQVYAVYWIDMDGSIEKPLATGTYDLIDPDFDPNTEYGKNGGNPLDPKDINGVTYVFDNSWKLVESEDEFVIIYEAVYTPQVNDDQGTNPTVTPDPTPVVNGPTENVTEIGNDPTPVVNTPAEEVSEIENNETPLAPATVDPVEDVDDEEVANNETPLAGFEVEPEEDDEIAEEATPLSPFTGDDRNTVVWGIVSILSLLGIVLVARRRKEE